jgi:uncharacterized membrane protein YsdA (DUF1294 family)/cold shock CspA family protein
MTKHQSQPAERAAAKQGESAWLHQGVLTEWNDERGYGFITPSDGGPKVFLHIKSLLPTARRPVAGELFSYNLTADEKGRPRAGDAFQSEYDERRPPAFHYSVLRELSRLWLLALIPPFLLVVRTGSLVPGVITAFAGNSLLTILFYRTDKYLAQYKYWRIPERNLHLWEFFCGWPGALYAQHAFRHKRNKTSYMIVFWLCVIVNAALLFLLFFYVDPAKNGKILGDWRHYINTMR